MFFWKNARKARPSPLEEVEKERLLGNKGKAAALLESYRRSGDIGEAAYQREKELLLKELV